MAALTFRSSLLWTHAGVAYCDVQQLDCVQDTTPWSKDLAVQVVSYKSEKRKPERHVSSILLHHTTVMFVWAFVAVGGIAEQKQCLWHMHRQAGKEMTL